MLFSDVQDWIKRFENEVCGKKKRIRGRIFSGVHLEMYCTGELVIVLEPGVEGNTLEEKTKSAIKEIFDPRVLECFISPARFKKIVAREDEIREEDWVWNDEQ